MRSSNDLDGVTAKTLNVASSIRANPLTSRDRRAIDGHHVRIINLRRMILHL